MEKRGSEEESKPIPSWKREEERKRVSRYLHGKARKRGR